MAKRFNSTFYDEYGTRFNLEIHDEEFAFTSTELICTGLTLDYEPQNGDKIYAPVISCGMTVKLALDYATAEGVLLRDMILDMAQEQDGRFWARLTEYGLSPNVFIGELIVEQVKRPNAPNASVTLTFTDGLTSTETIDYKDNLGAPFNPKTSATLWEHVQNCLSLMPIRNKYEASAKFLEVLTDWSHTDQKTTTPNLLEYTRVSHSKFTTLKDDGTYEVSKVFDVLVQILKPFYATIAYLPHPEGNYLLTHFNHLTSATIADRIYYTKDFTGVLESSRTNSNSGAVDLSGGNFTFIAGLKRVKMNFKYDRTSLSPDFQTQGSEPDTYTEIISTQITSDEERLIIWGTLNTRWSSNLITFWGVAAMFRIAVKVESATKTRWWEYDFSRQDLDQEWYSQIHPITDIGWSSTEKFSTVRSSKVKSFKGERYLNDIYVDLVSDPLTDEFSIGEEITVSTKVELYYLERGDISPSVVESIYDLINYERTLNVTVIEEGSADNIETKGLLITGTFNEQNVKEQEYDIELGYGQNASSSNLEIQKTDGSWVTAKNQWKKLSGEYYLYEIILQELYRLRASTLQSYTGVFKGAEVWGLKRFSIPHGDNEQLFAIQGSHNVKESTFSGTYVEPVVTLGSPVIEITKDTQDSSSSSSSTSTVTVPNSNGDLVDLPKIPFRVTGVTGLTFTINDIKVVDDTDYDLEQMLLFIKVQRGSVPLLYTKEVSLGRSEYTSTISADNTIITLGKEAKATDIFTGWIVLTS